MALRIVFELEAKYEKIRDKIFSHSGHNARRNFRPNGYFPNHGGG